VKPPVQHHPYVGDGRPDHRGQDRCADCGMPKTNQRHDLPAVPNNVRDAEARRLGEDES